MIHLESYPKHCEDIVCRTIDNEVVILTTDGKNIHTLNKVGSVIWELSDGTRSIKEIISLISGRYNKPFEVLKEDILEFETELVNKKLMEVFQS